MTVVYIDKLQLTGSHRMQKVAVFLKYDKHNKSVCSNSPARALDCLTYIGSKNKIVAFLY